ncbi:MAG: FeoA family protein [Candidatus Heimdallarchaeota archaeon]
MAKTDSTEVFCTNKLDDDSLKGKTISLTDLKLGNTAIVYQIISGHGACKRLNELGLIPGVEIELINRITSGPVMIRVKGSKLALGRGLARKVMVVVK